MNGSLRGSHAPPARSAFGLVTPTSRCDTRSPHGGPRGRRQPAGVRPPHSPWPPPAATSAHPRAPCPAWFWHGGVLATRKPMFVFRFRGSFLFRPPERTFPGLLFQEPPRRTREAGGGQAAAPGRTTRRG